MLLLILLSPIVAAAAAQQAARPPNVLLILADDMGWADAGGFGSEIRTPHLDQLAREGIRFTDFYTQPLCTPTRVSLMSGLDNHLAGAGTMTLFTAPNQQGKKGYSGELESGIQTLADVMKKAGYRTYMTGKWDLGRTPDKIPRARGFDRDFAMIDSHGSHYSMTNMYADNPKLIFTEDGLYLSELPEDYYSSRIYTDKMLKFIKEGRNSNQPFFAYLSYQAPHDPHQVEEPWRSMYRGNYDEGWTSIRQARFERQKEIGLIPDAAELAERYWYLPDSEWLSPVARAVMGRKMELYAGMVSNMDHHVGRVIDYLKEIGEYDNTIILFFGDNGPEGNTSFETLAAPGTKNDVFAARFWSETHINALGGPNAYSEYGPGWAQVSATPFYGHKAFTAEGSIRNGLIIRMPGSSHAGGSIRRDFMHVNDIMPTLNDLTGQPFPNGRPGGKSWLPMLLDPAKEVRLQEDWMGWEVLGSMALRKGDWKVSNIWPPYGSDDPASNGERTWRLFNVKNDMAERHNLAKQYPEKLEELVAIYEQDYMQKNNIIIPDRSYGEELWNRLPLRFPVSDNYPPALYRKQYVPPADMITSPQNDN